MRIAALFLAVLLTASYAYGQNITGYSPANKTVAAGIGATLTITGTGFGTDGTIKMPSADDDGQTDITLETTDYIWSNTEIVITMPSNVKVSNNTIKTPGSGKIKLIPDVGSTKTTDVITIPYAVTNFRVVNGTTVQKVRGHLGDDNGNGGYTFDYNFSANSGSSADAWTDTKQAMKDWRCASFVNFKPGNTTTTKISDDDGVNAIFFTDQVPVVLGAFTETHWEICGNIVVISDIDIALLYPLTNSSYQYGSTGLLNKDKVDFFYTIKHELGHAHLLNHVNQKHIMYYSSASNRVNDVLNKYRRLDIGTDEDAGADYVVDYSTSYTFPSNCPYLSGVMTKVLDCATSIAEHLPEGKLTIYPNPAQNMVVISAAENTLITAVDVYEVTGKIVSTVKAPVRPGAMEINTSGWAKGMYIIKAYTTQGVYIDKLLIE